MSLASQIEFHEVENNGFLVQHRSSNKYVKMGRREADFLKLLTDTEDLETAHQAYTGDLNEQERGYLAERFKEWGFLDRVNPDSEAGNEGRTRKWKFNWRLDDITTIKFLSVNPDQWLTGLMPVIRKLLHPAAMAVYTLLILVAGFMMVQDSNLASSITSGGLGFTGYAAIYVMILLTTMVHEVAHGMVCKYYGGRVKQMGAMLFYFNLAMFCDVSDTYVLRKKRHKLAVLFAGIFSQWVISALAVVSYYVLLVADLHAPLLLYYALANLGLSIMNMIPLVKLDGYWMLSHGLGIANLRTKAFRTTFLFLTPWRSKHPGSQPISQIVNKRERNILLAYGFAAAVYTPCFWTWGLYSVQQRLHDFLGPVSFVITAGICGVLLYHFAKFVRTLRVPV